MSADTLELVVPESMKDGYLELDGGMGPVKFKDASISRIHEGHATVSLTIDNESLLRDRLFNWAGSTDKTNKMIVRDNDMGLVCELFNPSSFTMSPIGKTIDLVVTAQIQ